MNPRDAGLSSTAGLIVVGTIGLLIERVVLQTLERLTVARWGTIRDLQ